MASALVAAPGFARTSNGFVGTSDGWTDLASDKTLDFDYDTAPDGNVLQTGEIALGRHDDLHARARLRRLDRGGRADAARASLAAGFAGARGGLRGRVARLPGRARGSARRR